MDRNIDEKQNKFCLCNRKCWDRDFQIMGFFDRNPNENEKEKNFGFCKRNFLGFNDKNPFEIFINITKCGYKYWWNSEEVLFLQQEILRKRFANPGICWQKSLRLCHRSRHQPSPGVFMRKQFEFKNAKKYIFSIATNIWRIYIFKYNKYEEECCLFASIYNLTLCASPF